MIKLLMGIYFHLKVLNEQTFEDKEFLKYDAIRKLKKMGSPL